MTITEPARKFNIPRSTVTDHVKGKGKARELSEEVETALVDYITYMSRQNFPFR